MNRFWGKTSPREQRLLGVTLGIVVAAAALFVGFKTVNAIRDRDAAIDSLEADLLYCTAEAARGYAVEKNFERIAAEHSSQFTQEEIHDGLRKEIQRLCTADDAQATPILTIPSLSYGRLTQSGDGFREYQITFKTAPAPIAAIALFLRRIEEESRALRVDSLVLDRAENTDLVTPTFVVTQVIVEETGMGAAAQPPAAAPVELAGRASPGGNLLRNPGFEEFTASSATFPGWDSQGCRLSQSTDHITEGASCLRTEATAADAYVGQKRVLTAGRAYELQVDVTALGPATLGVWDERAGRLLPGETALTPADGTCRFRVEVIAPGEPGTRAIVRIPYIRFDGPGSSVYLDNAVLSEAEK